MIALYFASFCRLRVFSYFGFLLQVRSSEWSVRLDCFQACDPRYCMGFVHGILSLVHNRSWHGNLFYDWELLMASICAILGVFSHMPTWDLSWVRHVFAPISRLFAGAQSLHTWVWLPKSVWFPQCPWKWMQFFCLQGASLVVTHVWSWYKRKLSLHWLLMRP